MKLILIYLLVIPLFANPQKKTVNLNNESGIDQHSFYIVAGEPFVTVRYTKIVEGTPYFIKQWLPGVLVASSGSKAYKIDNVKVDLITNEVFFIDKDGKEKIATVDFKEIMLYDSLTTTTFKLKKQVSFNSDDSKKNIWYLELVQGHVCLYKHIKKQILTSTSYGSNVEEQRVRDLEFFFLSVNDKFYPVTSLTELPIILKDKETELRNFIEQLKTKKKKSESIVQVVEYYNSIVQFKKL